MNTIIHANQPVGSGERYFVNSKSIYFVARQVGLFLIKKKMKKGVLVL